jgi:predicted component of type VI protein secretion system
MSDRPFRIALVGNFSGRRAPSAPMLVDPDNFEEVMERLDVTGELPAGAVRFRELDDFHPDHLYRQLALFQSLQDARQEIEHAPSLRTPQPARPERPPVASSGSLLDQIADASEPQPVSAAGFGK